MQSNESPNQKKKIKAEQKILFEIISENLEDLNQEIVFFPKIASLSCL